MKKLANLLQALNDPPLALAVDALTVWTEDGGLEAMPAEANGHLTLRYRAKVFFPDYAADPLVLLYFLQQWATRNERQHEPEALRFEADILDRRRVDLLVTLPLTETIRVDLTEAGAALYSVDDPDLNPVPLPSGDWATTLAAAGIEDKAIAWVNEGAP